MDILNRIWFGIKKFIWGTIYVQIALIIAIIIGLIWGIEAGVFTGLGIVFAAILFVFGRQIWWWITKTGDYKK